MSELAFNITGDAFDVPELVAGWRVKRLKPRGAPELVYGGDGFPLTVPIDCDMEGLRQAVGGVLGKYRLDAVDEQGKICEGVEPAYVTVAKVERARDADKPGKDESDSVLRDAMRLNTELARSVVDRFPEMMHAAAELLRAADGAGLPRREPRDVCDHDDDDGEEIGEIEAAPVATNVLVGIVEQIVPVVMTALVNGKFKLPNLAALFDWRKATPALPASNDQSAPKRAKAASMTRPEPTTASVELPPIDPKMMQHFIAIQAALTPEEAELAREVAKDLSPVQLREWFDSLGKLSVPDAVAMIRSIIQKEGDAS
jgi:hypothetical protein